MYHDTVTNHAAFIGTFNLTFTHDTTGNSSHFRDVEGLQHFECSGNFLLNIRRKHTFHSSLDFFDCVVDDGIDMDIHFLLIGHLASRRSRTNVKADDDSVRSGSQQYIAIRDSAYSTVDNIHLDILGREFNQRVGQCFNRTVYVTLDDDIQFLEVTNSQTATNLVQTDMFLRAE